MTIAKPPFSGSIVQVKAGYQLPAALMAKLVSENPTCFGMAVRTKKALDVETFAKADMPAEFLSFLKEIDQNTKDHWRMYVFQNHSGEFDETETQPITIIRDSKSKESMLVVATEGDYPKYTINGEGWSESFALIDGWLGPKIEDVYKLAGGSQQKLTEYLQNEQFRKDFSDQMEHRGAIGVMPLVGLPFMVEKNELGIQSEWGQCSNVYGYTEAVQETATVEERPASTVVRKTSKYASNADPTPLAPGSSPPAADPEVKKTPEEKVAASFTEVKETKTPPPNMHGKALKTWYRQWSADLPKNWADRPSVEVTVKRSSPGPSHVETETAASIMAKAATGAGETLPIISKDELASINAFIKKHIGDGSAVIDDPVRAAEDEARLATFHELTAGSGVKSIKDVLRWRTSFIFALAAKEGGKAMALAFIDLRNAFGALLEDEKKEAEVKPEIKPEAIPEVPAKRTSKYAS